MSSLHPKKIPAYLNSIPIGIIIIDQNSQVCGVNNAGIGMLGLEESDICRLIEKPDAKILNCQFWQSLSDLTRPDHSVPFFIAHYSRKNGTSKYLIVNSSKTMLDQQNSGYVICIDVITHEQLSGIKEYAILDSDRSLQKDRSEALMQLSQSVSHQILNPIMSISGFSRLVLKKGKIDDYSQSHLQVIAKEAARLEAIVKALSSYAAMTPGNRKKITADEIILSVQNFLIQKAAQAQKEQFLEINTEFDDNFLWGEPRLISIAFKDLVQNCVDFSLPDKVRVLFTLKGNPKGWTFSIQDKGMGIKKDVLPFVFDPFFSTKPLGIGMGLTRARKAIMEHRGNIDMKSAPDSGAVVQIYLPQRQRS